MRIYIDCDRHGIRLKKEILSWSQQCNLGVKDLCYGIDSPYPLIANNMAFKLLENPNSYGILICKTGIGMSIVANKHWGIYANVCNSPKECSCFRKVNNGNLLCLGAEFVPKDLAIELCEIFISTDFDSSNIERLCLIESIFPRDNV